MKPTALIRALSIMLVFTFTTLALHSARDGDMFSMIMRGMSALSFLCLAIFYRPETKS